MIKFNSYGPTGADAVQLKADSVENDTSLHYNIGDRVNIQDGIYIGLNGVIVVFSGILVAYFGHPTGSFPTCFHDMLMNRLRTLDAFPSLKGISSVWKNKTHSGQRRLPPSNTMQDGIFVDPSRITVIYLSTLVADFDEVAGQFPAHVYDQRRDLLEMPTVI